MGIASEFPSENAGFFTDYPGSNKSVSVGQIMLTSMSRMAVASCIFYSDDSQLIRRSGRTSDRFWGAQSRHTSKRTAGRQSRNPPRGYFQKIPTVETS